MWSTKYRIKVDILLITAVGDSPWRQEVPGNPEDLMHPPSAPVCVSDPNSYRTFSILAPLCTSTANVFVSEDPPVMAHLLFTPSQSPLQCLGSLCYSLLLEETSIPSPMCTHSTLALPPGSYSALSLEWTPWYMMSTFAPDSDLCFLAPGHINMGRRCPAHIIGLEPTKAWSDSSGVSPCLDPLWQQRFRHPESQTCSWRTNTKAVSKDVCQHWGTQPV